MFQKLCISVFLFGTLTTSTFAARPVDLKQQPAAFLRTFAVGAQTNMQQVSSDVDLNQTTHVRLKQTYRNYPVWGGDAVVHIPHAGQDRSLTAAANNRQSTMNGTVYQDLQADLASTPEQVFSPEQAHRALQRAIQIEGARRMQDPLSTLMVYIDNNNMAHWAFIVSYLTEPVRGIPARPTFIMDATTFEIYQRWNNIQTLDNVTGGGVGGNPTAGRQMYLDLQIERNASTKKCFLRNSDVVVKDARHRNAVSSFACNRTNSEHGNIYWNAGTDDSVNGGYAPSNDAFAVGQVIKNMYQTWYGIPVLTNGENSMLLTMRVHAKDDDGTPLENAYWDGTQMTFGDGADTFYPLVSLGVGSHEISHGFTEQHSNLQYFGQSGGLNESFSDMAAQAAEFYARHQNSWKIGHDILKENNSALRYLDEPTRDCGRSAPGLDCSISQIRDYRSGLDVHFSSGVFNKVFYLLSTSTGWDTKKAFDVMVQANRNYWTPMTNFNNAACGVLSATRDYHYSVQAVESAMAAVGISLERC